MEWKIGITTGLISGLVTGTLTCWFFYWLSGKDLKREAEDLRKLNILIIRALKEAGLADANFDANGKPRGLVLKLRASVGATMHRGSAATLEVQRNPQNQG
jgi:hypothetical protein